MEELIYQTHKDELKVTRTLIEMFTDRQYTFSYDTKPYLDLIEQLLDNQIKSNMKTVINDLFQGLGFVNQKVNDLGLLPKDRDGLPIYVWIDGIDQIYSDKKPARDRLITLIKNNLKSVYPDVGKAKEFSGIYLTEDDQGQTVPRIRLIVVLNYPGSVENTKTELQTLDIPTFEIWKSDSLKFNKTKHSLVPVHRLMSSDEIKAYLVRYDINRKQAEKMLFDDPINRYYDGKIGDGYEITRMVTGEPSCRIVIGNKMAETAKKRTVKKTG